MLPSNLLRARISRGRIRPAFVGLDADTVALAERITGIYRDGVGKRKGELLERLKEVENEGHDFKLVRGLSTLLERRCIFEAESALNPVEARKAVFKEASRARASGSGERNSVLQKASMGRSARSSSAACPSRNRSGWCFSRYLFAIWTSSIKSLDAWKNPPWLYTHNHESYTA